MADKRAIWGLGTLEAEVSRIGSKFSRSRVKSWDVAFAAGLTVACLLSYEVITLLIAHRVSRGDDFLGGMWATVATIFVFRRAGTGGLAAGVARFVATCVSRPATAQAPGLAAPFCACSRDVGADGGAVEHLHQVCCRAERRQCLEERLEHTAAAQPREPLPHGVPGAVFGWKRSPGHVLNREEVQRLEEAAVIATLVATPRKTSSEHVKGDLPIGLGHPRQHRIGPALPTRYESPNKADGNPTADSLHTA